MQLSKTPFIAPLAAVTLALLFSTAASAGSTTVSTIQSRSANPYVDSPWQVCGQGKVEAMNFTNISFLRIRTTSMPAPAGQYASIPGLGNMIEMQSALNGRVPSDPADIGAEQKRLLELAVVKDLPVQIMAKGPSCATNTSNFDITLCKDESSCSQAR
ncbi:hypothetical protein ACVW0Y_002615 [Pseudomonas sp. TE3786]